MFTKISKVLSWLVDKVRFNEEDRTEVVRPDYSKRIPTSSKNSCCIDEEVDYGPHPELFEPDSSETVYSEITEVIIDGEKWFYCQGFHKNRPGEGKLRSGDVVVFKEGRFKENGIMIVKSFDFESDIAARALIGKSPYTDTAGNTTYTYYDDFTPGMHYYRLATEEETREFLYQYREKNPFSWEMNLKSIFEFNNQIFNNVACTDKS